MKIFIYNQIYHHKNKNFINNYIQKYHTQVNNINDAEIIYSPCDYIDIHKYPNKKFIFGPHFSVFPNQKSRKLNNIHNNAVYIQPSKWCVDVWKNDFNFNNLPIRGIPFGVDTEKFKSNNLPKNNVILYSKHRNPNDLKLLVDFLNNKNLKYKLFCYKKKYKESEFLSYLKTCKFGIVLDAHESQGFAIQEMLSCNIPLLVWGVKLMVQQYPYHREYKNIKTTATTIPYWSSKCGEIFYNANELQEKYNTFVNKLDDYEPRKFIQNNTSREKCYEIWNKLISSI